MLKLLTAAAALVIAARLFLGVVSLQDKSKIEALERSPDRGKLSWHAQMAKAKGQQSANLGSIRVEYAVPRNMDEALANYHVIVAETVDSRSYATTYNIITWYKFRLVEELSAPVINCLDCCSSPPADLLTLQSNEFLAAKIGGETVVDGIKITSNDSKFPNFELGKRYLLFVAFDSNKIVGELRTGPWGTFVLDSAERLAPVNATLRHALRERLTEQFGNSLSNLRLALKNKSL